MKEEIQDEALRIVNEEVTEWEPAIAWVTDRIGFRMRDLIRQFRNNYWGVYKKPTDKTTGRRKIWIPLTQSLVDAVTKNINTASKDVKIRAKNTDAVALARIVRFVIKNYLDKTGFDEDIDVDSRQLAIDGTIVWKTNNEGKESKRSTVDLLNIYIDPTADSIQSTYRFTERVLMLPEEVKGMKAWLNTEDIQGTVGQPKTDRDFVNAASPGTAKLVDVYEMWGMIPKWLITGNKEDKDEIDGRIIVSGLKGQGPKVHLIRRNTNKDAEGNIIKPYEEAWYIRTRGRWYGKGIAETVIMLQAWLNTIVNIRINRAYIAQLGTFKIRRGANITPQMLSKLPANGGIMVNSMDDVEQMVMQEASASSYRDEDVAVGWAQRATSAFEAVTGEGPGAASTATTSVIQERNSKSQFALVKDGIGRFVERWLERHILPKQMENLQIGDIVRILNDDEQADELFERVAMFFVDEGMEDGVRTKRFQSIEDVNEAVESAKNELRSRPELFVEMLEQTVASGLEVSVETGSDKFDTGVAVRNLIDMLNIAPEFKDDTVKQIYDLLELPRPRKQAPTEQEKLEKVPGQNSPTALASISNTLQRNQEGAR